MITLAALVPILILAAAVFFVINRRTNQRVRNLMLLKSRKFDDIEMAVFLKDSTEPVELKGMVIGVLMTATASVWTRRGLHTDCSQSGAVGVASSMCTACMYVLYSSTEWCEQYTSCP